MKEEEAPTLEYISGKSRAKPDTEEAAWTALQEAWKDLDTTLTLLKADSEAVAELKDALNAERHASDILRQQVILSHEKGWSNTSPSLAE